MDSDKPGEHDRTVVRALRSLGPPTAPTTTERARMKARLLAALDAEDETTTDEIPAALPRPRSKRARAAWASRKPTAQDPKQATPKPVHAKHPDEAGPDAKPPAEANPAKRPGTPSPAAEHPDEAGPNAKPPAGASPANRPGTPSPAAKASAGTRPKPSAETRPAKRPGAPSPAAKGPGGTGPAAKRSGAKGAGRRPAPAGGGTEGRDDARRSVLAGVRGRFAVAAVAVLALVGSLAGMSLLLARDALPGDALYGVKRTAEAASLGLTFGDEPKALKHLEFAAARVTEIETLARRYPRPGDAPVGGYLTALTDFDNDAAAGSRQLIALATRSDGRLLESLRDWATQQTGRHDRVAARLPEAARNRQITSLALLDKITTRAVALLARMDCYQITSGSYDDIGATPATGPCEQPGSSPGLSSSTSPSVPSGPDNSTAPDESTRASVPLVPAEPTPELPPVPVPGITASVPAPATRPGAGDPVESPTEEPPLLGIPSLLPELPGLGIG